METTAKQPLPEPVPHFCYGQRLAPCKCCGADIWKSLGDRDRGDWDEEIFVCQHCDNRIHVELPE